MAETERVGDLEIVQDDAFQERAWRIQRACWAAMLLTVVAGLLGLLGTGPLDRGAAAGPGGTLRLDYPRFGRLEAPCRLEVHLRAGRPGEARIWLSHAYLDAVAIERVEPPPVRVEADADRSAYVLRLARPDGSAVVTFALRPDRIGLAEAEVSLDDGPSIRFTQFVYP